MLFVHMTRSTLKDSRSTTSSCLLPSVDNTTQQRSLVIIAVGR